MKDPTENVRRTMIATGQAYQDCLEADRHWTTDQLREEFEVDSFVAPFVVVVRKADGARGSMEFTHDPRLYFNFLVFEKE